jgi:hypothetical protein
LLVSDSSAGAVVKAIQHQVDDHPSWRTYASFIQAITGLDLSVNSLAETFLSVQNDLLHIDPRVPTLANTIQSLFNQLGGLHFMQEECPTDDISPEANSEFDTIQTHLESLCKSVRELKTLTDKKTLGDIECDKVKEEATTALDSVRRVRGAAKAMFEQGFGTSLAALWEPATRAARD